MKKIIALILACLMLFSVVMVFTSCDEEPVDNDKEKEEAVAGVVRLWNLGKVIKSDVGE